jgi:hypothetical protein
MFASKLSKKVNTLGGAQQREQDDKKKIQLLELL